MARKADWSLDLPTISTRHGGAIKSKLFDSRSLSRYEDLMNGEGRKRGPGMDIDTILGLYALSHIGVVSHQSAIEFREMLHNVLDNLGKAKDPRAKELLDQYSREVIQLGAVNMMVATGLTHDKITEHLDGSVHPSEKFLEPQRRGLLASIFGGNDDDRY